MTKNKKSTGFIWILAASVLVIATIGIVYFAAGKYRDSISGAKKGNDTEKAVGQDVSGQGDDGQNAGSPGSLSTLNMTPVSIVFVTNSETGKIEHILIEILRCAANKLDYIRIDPEVSYTMSAKLYSSLTPDNTELPQTVTFSELYRYYHNDKAYEAGRQIVNEMINFNAPYYTAVTDVAFDEFIVIEKAKAPDSEAGGEAEASAMHFALGENEIKSASFGSEGSVKGALEKILDKAVTNWSIGDRLRYLDVYDALTEENVAYTDAPVKVKNESTALDSPGLGAILFKILY